MISVPSQNQNIIDGEINGLFHQYREPPRSGFIFDKSRDIHPNVQKLLEVKVPEQRTPAWFAARRNRVTASSAASLLKRTENVMKEFSNRFIEDDHHPTDGKCANPYSSMKKYIIDKCEEPTWNKGSPPLWWGTMLEQVASDIYSRRINEEVKEFGLMPHPTLDWLAASPDGITPSGIMLEIKCPWRRKITGIPPFYYWVQIQLQLEVCDLEFCDFEECAFEEYRDFGTSYGKDVFKREQLFLEDILDDDEEKGLIIRIIDMKDPEPPHRYYYPPVTMTDPIKLLEWRDNTIKEAEAAHTIQCHWRAYFYRKKLIENICRYKALTKIKTKTEKTKEVTKEVTKVTKETENKLLPSHICYDITIEDLATDFIVAYNYWNGRDDLRYTYDTFFWKLLIYSVVRVKREKKWFDRCGPILKTGWEKVLWHRKHGWDDLKNKKRENVSSNNKIKRSISVIEHLENIQRKITEKKEADRIEMEKIEMEKIEMEKIEMENSVEKSDDNEVDCGYDSSTDSDSSRQEREERNIGGRLKSAVFMFSSDSEEENTRNNTISLKRKNTPVEEIKIRLMIESDSDDD